MDAEDCHSGTSSDRQPEKSSDDDSPFYECNFCKRGFNNAQALGGHMNIHRKEKKKSKTKPKAEKRGTSTTTGAGAGAGVISEDDCYGRRVISHQQHQHQHQHQQQQQYQYPLNYQFYYPTANPTFPLAYHMITDFTAPHHHNHHHLGVYEDHGIQAEVAGGSSIRGWNFENEIDLELHL